MFNYNMCVFTCPGYANENPLLEIIAVEDDLEDEEMQGHIDFNLNDEESSILGKRENDYEAL